MHPTCTSRWRFRCWHKLIPEFAISRHTRPSPGKCGVTRLRRRSTPPATAGLSFVFGRSCPISAETGGATDIGELLHLRSKGAPPRSKLLRGVARPACHSHSVRSPKAWLQIGCVCVAHAADDSKQPGRQACLQQSNCVKIPPPRRSLCSSPLGDPGHHPGQQTSRWARSRKGGSHEIQCGPGPTETWARLGAASTC